MLWFGVRFCFACWVGFLVEGSRGFVSIVLIRSLEPFLSYSAAASEFNFLSLAHEFS